MEQDGPGWPPRNVARKGKRTRRKQTQCFGLEGPEEERNRGRAADLSSTRRARQDPGKGGGVRVD
ncbi:hypothetical protein O9K51_05237 [Purpureocillium lavendulum]|uniref:Uncharacterized protein n=1 Tax=Purpureocillium lavendulum TaxID=1247861 RepID=A0AB34FTH6_9HYPO|nr:hypothetical protein O9K51_05237 [Purpureocillium lavendulum]